MISSNSVSERVLSASVSVNISVNISLLHSCERVRFVSASSCSMWIRLYLRVLMFMSIMTWLSWLRLSTSWSGILKWTERHTTWPVDSSKPLCLMLNSHYLWCCMACCNILEDDGLSKGQYNIIVTSIIWNYELRVVYHFVCMGYQFNDHYTFPSWCLKIYCFDKKQLIYINKIRVCCILAQQSSKYRVFRVFWTGIYMHYGSIIS